jgi:hypothetical protein
VNSTWSARTRVVRPRTRRAIVTDRPLTHRSRPARGRSPPGKGPPP